MKFAHLALASSILLAGCTGLVNKVEKSVDTGYTKGSQLAQETRIGEITPKIAPVTSVDSLWVGQKTVRIKPRLTLPAVFAQPATFDRSVSGVQEFAERLTLRTGLAVRITSDALTQASSVTGSSSRGTLNTASVNNASPLPPSYPGATSLTRTSAGSSEEGIRISYNSGSLQGLLDTVAFRFGISWKYENEQIVFYHLETRTMRVLALAGTSATKSSVSPAIASGGGSNGAGSNASGSTQFSTDMSVWANLESSIKAMMSSSGKFASSPATGSITITDIPAVLDEVTAYVDAQNGNLSRQVTLNVLVMTVTLQDDDAYGIDWNVVYGNASRDYGIITNLGLGATTPNIFRARDPSRGNSILAQALSTQGKVRKETAASLTVLNHQPVPLQVVKNQAYLAQTSTTISDGVPTTTLTPGNISSGFTMQLLPSIQDNGKILLQFATTLSILRRITEFTSNNASIQLPEVDTRDFLQRVSLNSGETLVVSGFEQTNNNIDWQGIGTPRNIFFGGSMKAGSGKEIIVIAITPILNRSE